MNKPHISEVTKALKMAGYKAVTMDEVCKGRQPLTFYKYEGALYITAGRVSFSIESAKDAQLFGKYHTSAIDNTGAAHEIATNWPELFFPRLFGFLRGEISEDQIIAEICK